MDGDDGFVMAAESQDVSVNARDFGGLLMKRLEAGKQSALAHELGVDPATMSNFIGGKGGLRAHQFMALLAALNLKLVDSDTRSVKDSTFREFTRLTAMALLKAPHLLLEDDE